MKAVGARSRFAGVGAVAILAFACAACSSNGLELTRSEIKTVRDACDRKHRPTGNFSRLEASYRSILVSIEDYADTKDRKAFEDRLSRIQNSCT